MLLLKATLFLFPLFSFAAIDLIKEDSKTIHIAVASNFKPVMKSLINQFKRKNPGHKIILSSGSTGKLYAQITQSAPYDIFLAADSKRPSLLEKSGLSIKDSRKTYALGQLALYRPSNKTHTTLRAMLNSPFSYFAIANPKLAPYGDRAKEVLKKIHKWRSFKNKVVRGENIASTFNYIKSGNAQMGFVALSQVKSYKQTQRRLHYWVLPSKWYTPIKQQMVLLKNTIAAKKFYTFMNSKQAKRSIHHFGYGLDNEK